MATISTNGVAVDSLSTASGLLKTCFGDFFDLTPEQEVLQKILSYTQFQKIGRNYETAVQLEFGHSVTALGDNDQVWNFNTPVWTPLQNAVSTAFAFAYREVLTQTILERASTGGPEAFKSAAATAIERGTKSMQRIVEELLMNGTQPIVTFTATTTDLGNNTITSNAQTFAPAIFIGSKNMPIDIYNASTKAFVLSTTVASVAYASKQFILASVAGLSNTVTYNVYRKGFYGLLPTGLFDIQSSTSGLFGISEAAYELWYPNNYAIVGTSSLSFGTIASTIALFKPKGLAPHLKGIIGESSFMDLLPSYNTINNNSTTPGARASRVFVDDKGNLIHGYSELTFSANSIEVELMTSPYQQYGQADFIDPSSLYRIGSTEKPMKFLEVAGPERYLSPIPNTSLYEFRLFSDLSLFTTERNRNFRISNITPGTGA